MCTDDPGAEGRLLPPASRSRIAAVTQYYPPHVGGLEVVAMKQATSHLANGHRVSVVTCALDDAPPGTRVEDGVTVHRARAWNYPDQRFGLPFAPIGWGLLQEIGRVVKANDLVMIHDVFYPTSWAAWFWARRYGRPCLLTQHVGLVDHSSLAVRLMQRLVYATVGQRIFDSSARIIVYNPNVRAFLRSRGVPDASIVEVRNGIEVQTFRPPGDRERAGVRRRYGLPEDRPVVLFVGRLVPKKGFDVLLEARDERFELVFVGSGDIGRDLGGMRNVRFLGPRDRTEVRELYQASDLFVLPTRGELFTLAMQEAMACGLPVITTDDPGYAAYDLDRSLLRLIEPTPARLRASILEIIGDDGLRAAMSRYSRALAEAWFDWDTNFSPVEAICNEALAETPELR